MKNIRLNLKNIVGITSLVSLFSVSVVQASEELSIFAWAESISPALISNFEKETGVTVSVGSYTSNEDALTKLQSGASSYDLATPTQHFVKIMIESNLLIDYDAHSLPAYENVKDEWKNQWWDEGNVYSLPFAHGSTSFVINRDLYAEPVDSWETFFRPSSDLSGKIANLGSADEVITSAQIYLGIDFCSEDVSEMKQVLDLLVAQKPSVAVYSSDNIGARIGGGEVAMHTWWDGNTYKLRAEAGANVEYIYPKEGVTGWMDSFVIPKGAENVDNAIKFINFMSTPEHATEQFNYYAHSSPVNLVEADAKYTPENAPELYPTVPVIFQPTCSPAAQELITKVWSDLLK